MPGGVAGVPPAMEAPYADFTDGLFIVHYENALHGVLQSDNFCQMVNWFDGKFGSE
jgi:hypothetical protein